MVPDLGVEGSRAEAARLESMKKGKMFSFSFPTQKGILSPEVALGAVAILFLPACDSAPLCMWPGICEYAAC